MTKKVYRVRNWRQYNKALCHRGSLTFWFSAEVLSGWKEDRSSWRHGNQVYTDMFILSALTLRQIYRLPLRATTGLMSSIIQLLKRSDKVAHYSTLCRRARSLHVSLAVKHSERARHVLIDSTGVQVIGESEWKYFKYGVKKCRYQTWKKLHITMDAETQEILSATMTDSINLDSNSLPDLVQAIPGKISQITGDGAYDKKNCYQSAHERNAKPVFPPQHNASLQRNKYKKNLSLLARDKIIEEIGRGRTPERHERLRLWKKANQYHRRSLVETAMFRLKSLFGDQMRSRHPLNQLTDLLIRCYAMNRITALGMPDSEPIN